MKLKQNLQHLREHVPALALTHFTRKYSQSFAEDPLNKTKWRKWGFRKRLRYIYGSYYTLTFSLARTMRNHYQTKDISTIPESIRIKGCDNWRWKDDANEVSSYH